MNERIAKALNDAGFVQVRHDLNFMEVEGVWENGTVPAWVTVISEEYHYSCTSFGVFIAGWNVTREVQDLVILYFEQGELAAQGTLEAAANKDGG